jgi:tetratricopeptide (TPR) repeat protein
MPLDWNFIVPLALLIISIIVILIIFIRKFPDLVLVDVNSIPEEREKQLKDKLLADRLQRRASGFFGRFLFVFQAIGGFFSAILRSMKNKIQDWEHRYRFRYKPVMKNSDMKDKVNVLLEKATQLFDLDKHDESERVFLEVINLDKYNVEAYRGLGRLYYRLKEYQQSKEIFQFALKLCVENKKNLENVNDCDVAQLAYHLGLVCKALDDIRGAINYFKQALEKEENSPKYLDALLEMAIMAENKKLAQETFEKLKEVNPQNTKLEELQAQINDLDDSDDEI